MFGRPGTVVVRRLRSSPATAVPARDRAGGLAAGVTTATEAPSSARSSSGLIKPFLGPAPARRGQVGRDPVDGRPCPAATTGVVGGLDGRGGRPALARHGESGATSGHQRATPATALFA